MMVGCGGDQKPEENFRLEDDVKWAVKLEMVNRFDCEKRAGRR